VNINGNFIASRTIEVYRQVYGGFVWEYIDTSEILNLMKYFNCIALNIINNKHF